MVNQTDIFLMSVAGGIISAFIYDLFRIRRRIIRACDILVHVEDLLYWILIAVLFFIIAYYSNDGEIRGYMFIGAAIGAILYIFTFSRLIMKIFLTTVNCIRIILNTIAGILAYPFSVLFGVFRKTFSCLRQNVAETIRKIFKK